MKRSKKTKKNISIKETYKQYNKTNKTLKRNPLKLSQYKSNKINNIKINDTCTFINYIRNIFENVSFDYDKLNNVNYFSKDKIGKSGGQIGFINYKNSIKIIKIFKRSQDSLFIEKNKDCVFVNYDFNELLISYLLNNISLVLNEAKNKEFKRRKFSNHIISNYLCKISKKNIFLINEAIGVKYKDTYYTNLHEILLNNYIPYINKLLDNIDNTQNKNKLDSFLKNFSKLLSSWCDVQLFLYQNIGLINTDAKTANIFIKETKNNDKEEYIKNITFLISDLDKSRYKLNNKMVLCNNIGIVNKMKQKIAINTHFEHINTFRYNCLVKSNFCSHFKGYHFDRLILYVDIYANLYKNIYLINKKKNNNININEFFDIFNILNKTIKKELNLSNEKFELFKKLIDSSNLFKTNIIHKVSYHINIFIYKYCNELNKMK